MTISATIIGNLGADPETRHTPNGNAVTEARVATTHGWGDRKTTTWVKVTLWGKKGEAFARHHRKGDQAILLGCSMHLEEWQGKDGVMKTLKAEASDFVFAKRDGGRQQQGGGYGGGQQQPPQNYSTDDSSIPF